MQRRSSAGTAFLVSLLLLQTGGTGAAASAGRTQEPNQPLQTAPCTQGSCEHQRWALILHPGCWEQTLACSPAASTDMCWL